jgi:superfamily II DNA helicase RecQ
MLSPDDERVFDALRFWRREAAAGKPAYTVAHDRTLRAIAVTRPRSAAELEAIPGIGPAFIDLHATSVLRIVTD